MGRLRPWVMGVVLGAIPVSTYAWMIYTRPNIYEQIADEIRRQEEAEKAKRGLPAGAK